MKYYQLYMIRNKINHKIYIGQTQQRDGNGYQIRFKEHLTEVSRGTVTRLYNSMRKHGIDNFELRLLISNIPEENINFYERLWIQKFNSYNCGYNMTIGGSGTVGCEFDQQALSKMGKASKRFWDELKADKVAYDEFVQHRAEKQRGKPKSAHHKKLLSNIAKHRTGSKNPFYGRHHSDETKRKQALIKGRKVSMLDPNTCEVIETFDTMLDATDWLIEHGKTTNRFANSRIQKVCVDGNTAYGYKWKYQE